MQVFEVSIRQVLKRGFVNIAGKMDEGREFHKGGWKGGGTTMINPGVSPNIHIEFMRK